MHLTVRRQVLSPCARLSQLTLRTLADVPALDALFEEITSWRLAEYVKSSTGSPRILALLSFADLLPTLYILDLIPRNLFSAVLPTELSFSLSSSHVAHFL